jgi:hypothetical protein
MRPGVEESCKSRRRAPYGHWIQMLAVVQPQRSDWCFAQRGGLFQHHVKNWLEIPGRGVDYAENFGGGGLLLQRFAQLVEQSGVLDGDDGLLGEIAHQLDLLVAERSDLLTVDDESPDQLAFLF